MSIAHSVMLLVTLLFVLTTRGVSHDFHTPFRYATRTDISSPLFSPPLKRRGSALLAQDRSETERTPDPTGELRKIRSNWGSLPPSRDSTQSAPASPSRLLRHWNSPLTPSSNRDRSPSDEETRDSDDEYANLSSTAQARGSLDELFGRNEGTVENNDYPTPLSNEEMLE
jgi:hypothetical protein